MAKGKSQKENNGNLEHQEGRKTERIKIWANSMHFPSPLEFSKLSLTTEAKTGTPLDVVLNVHRENV